MESLSFNLIPNEEIKVKIINDFIRGLKKINNSYYILNLFNEVSLQMYSYSYVDYVNFFLKDSVMFTGEVLSSEDFKKNRSNLVMLEYLKNIRESLNIDSPYHNFSETDIMKELTYKITQIVQFLGLDFTCFYEFSLNKYSLTDVNLLSLLDLSGIQSDLYSGIDWKTVVLKTLSKTGVTASEQIGMLRIIQTVAERYREKMKESNPQVEKELFKNLNTLEIRHSAKPEELTNQLGEFTEERYNTLIKKTVQLLLLGLIIADE